MNSSFGLVCINFFLLTIAYLQSFLDWFTPVQRLSSLFWKVSLQSVDYNRLQSVATFANAANIGRGVPTKV